VDISPGLPSFTIVGLPDAAVQEARERVRAAIRHSGCSFPTRRIVVNLAPANLKKAGPAYDLPIAVGILLSSEQIQADVTQAVVLGELSLDGSLRHTNGVLPMAALACEKGFTTLIVPEADAKEASLIEGAKIIPIASLAQLVSYLRGEIPPPEYQPDDIPEYAPAQVTTDLAYIKGQEHVKRALEVAASGGHNLIMVGPPGSGKTLLARTLPSILPPMTIEESLEVTKIYSISGLLPTDIPLMRQRPFRSPHYTISNAGLVGGGHWPKPGEISLSHRGVLFLDECRPSMSHCWASLPSTSPPRGKFHHSSNGAVLFFTNVLAASTATLSGLAPVPLLWSLGIRSVSAAPSSTASISLLRCPILTMKNWPTIGWEKNQPKHRSGSRRPVPYRKSASRGPG